MKTLALIVGWMITGAAASTALAQPTTIPLGSLQGIRLRHVYIDDRTGVRILQIQRTGGDVDQATGLSRSRIGHGFEFFGCTGNTCHELKSRPITNSPERFEDRFDEFGVAFDDLTRPSREGEFHANPRTGEFTLDCGDGQKLKLRRVDTAEVASTVEHVRQGRLRLSQLRNFHVQDQFYKIRGTDEYIYIDHTEPGVYLDSQRMFLGPASRMRAVNLNDGRPTIEMAYASRTPKGRTIPPRIELRGGNYHRIVTREGTFLRDGDRATWTPLGGASVTLEQPRIAASTLRGFERTPRTLTTPCSQTSRAEPERPAKSQPRVPLPHPRPNVR